MPLLILIGLIIAIGLIALVFAFLKVALVAWLTAVVLHLLLLEVIRDALVRVQSRVDRLPRFLTPRVDTRSIRWTVDEEEVRQVGDRAGAMVGYLGTPACLVLGLVAFDRVRSTGHMGGLLSTFHESSREQLLVLCGIITAIVLVIDLGIYKPARRYRGSLSEALTERGEAASATLYGLVELDGLKTDIGKVTKQLGIKLDLPYDRMLGEYLKQHCGELIQHPQALADYVAECIREERRDLVEIEHVRDDLAATRVLYLEAAGEATRSGRQSLVDLADQIGEGLGPENLLAIIADRKWPDVHSILDMMRSDLVALRDAASRHEEPTDADPGDQPESDYEKACRILGVPIGTGRDKALKVFRSLADAWHPDHRRQESERMIDLNWAHDYVNGTEFEKESSKHV